ncbi:MAG: type II toxin-antitoxin system HicB family antitoxin [Chloroflexi bacterium]|nr:type II toxin-antitoxin system HicB family antitoxin [Chloroflexota bacterium]
MPASKKKSVVKRPVETGFKLSVTAELALDEEEGGYSVYCPELDIYTQGETIEECLLNLQEAAVGYIQVVGIENLKLRQKPVIRKEVELTVYA